MPEAQPTPPAEQTRIEALAKSDDWKAAKRLLSQKLLSATSLLDMPETVRRDAVQVEARFVAANLIVDWMGEIDGSEAPRDNGEEVDPDTLRGLLRLR